MYLDTLEVCRRLIKQLFVMHLLFVPAAGQQVPGLITMRKNWQTEFHQFFTLHIPYIKSCEGIIVSTYLHIICCIIEQYNSRISETLAVYTIRMWVHM